MKKLEQLLEQAINEKNVTALSNLKDFALHLQSYEIAANIRDYIKKLTPLFTSEDGIDIFEGDEFTLVVFYENKWFKYKRFKTTKFVEPKNDDLKKFADDLKALEFVESQKPKYKTVKTYFGLEARIMDNSEIHIYKENDFYIKLSYGDIHDIKSFLTD